MLGSKLTLFSRLWQFWFGMPVPGGLAAIAAGAAAAANAADVTRIASVRKGASLRSGASWYIRNDASGEAILPHNEAILPHNEAVDVRWLAGRNRRAIRCARLGFRDP
jgi:hypothetical protein